MISPIFQARKQDERSWSAWPASHSLWEINQNQSPVSTTDIKGCSFTAPQRMKPRPLERVNGYLLVSFPLLHHYIICFYLNDQLRVLLLFLFYIGWLCISTFPTKPVGTEDGSMTVNAFPTWLLAFKVY